MRKAFAVLLILASLPAIGCDVGRANSENNQSAEDEVWQDQVDVFDRQTEQMDRILSQQESELQRAKAQSDRYEKLLSKWEEHVRRADAVLEAEEKKAGIKP
jgi:hypothetical protein